MWEALSVGPLRFLYRRCRFALAGSELVQRGRARRYELFARECSLATADSVLDVGSGSGKLLEHYNAGRNRIVAIDVSNDAKVGLSCFPNVEFVRADATKMPFRDGEFDIVFSNSVVEHLAPDARRRYANEIRRVGERYFVQTPNRFFPIEPHYMLPLVQFLPKWLRSFMDVRLFYSEPIELLTEEELRRLFPDAEIRRERIGPFTKSLIAVRTH